MSVYSNEIDLEILKYALEHHAASLPDDVSQSLLEALQAWQNQEPNAAKRLCDLVICSEEIDRIYTQALTVQRQHYTAQERAKSYVLTADSFSDRNGLSHLANELTHILAQSQQQKSATQTSEAEWEILKALETHPLRTKDLAYSIDSPLAITRTAVQVLWQKGYVELLSAPLAYYVFPGLRRASDRQRPLADDEFLSLTSTGYFRLHPLIQFANRGQ